MERWEFERARELLDSLRPAQGQEDLRGFEWYYLRGQGPTQRLLAGHQGKVHAAIFSPDGQTLATVSADRTVKLWDTHTGKERTILKGHQDGIRSLRFSANGKLIVTGDAGRTVRVWDADTGKGKAVLATKNLKWKQHPRDDDGSVAAAVVSPDGRYVAVACQWEMKVLEAGTGKVKFGLEFESSWGYSAEFYKECMHCPVFSPDSQLLVVSTSRFVPHEPGGSSGRLIGQIRTWEMATGKERPMMEYPDSESGRILFSADGKTLVTLARLGHSVRVWDMSNPKERANLEHGHDIYGFVLSQDGRTVAISGRGLLSFWNTATRKLKGKLVVGGGPFLPELAFSPLANLLVSGVMSDKEHFGLNLYDPETGKELARSDNLQGNLDAVAFLSDTTIAGASIKDNQVTLVTLPVERVPRKYSGFENRVTTLAFSPNGRDLLASSDGRIENSLRVWDLGTGRERESLRLTHAWPGKFVFSPDGNMVATVGQGFQRTFGPVDGKNIEEESPAIVKVWSPTTGKVLWTIEPAEAASPVLTWTPDGNALITGGCDKTVRVWDTAVRKQRLVLKGHTAPIEGAVLSPDGDNTTLTIVPLTQKTREKAVFFILYTNTGDIAVGCLAPPEDTLQVTKYLGVTTM